MKVKNKRISRLNTPALAGMWYTVSTVLERGSAILFTPIYTRLLLPSQYGTYSLYTSFMGILSVISTLEISGSAALRGLKEFKDKGKFISAALGLLLLSTSVSLAVYAPFSERINAFTGLDTKLTLILFLQVLLNGIRALKISEARFFYNKRIPLAEGIFFSVVVPTVSIILILYYKKAGYARIYSTLFASAAFAVPIVIKALKNGRFRLFDKDTWRFLLKYTIPSLPHYLSISLVWQIGKIIVGNRFSSGEAGLLSLAISVGLLPTLLTLGMQSALIPWIMRKLSEGKGGIEKIYSLILTVFFPLCLLILLFLLLCPELFAFMSAGEYATALTAVYPIAASVPAVFLTNLTAAEISYYKKTYFVALGSLLGAAFSVIFNLLFTFKLGFKFSAFIILPAFTLMFSVYLVILKRVFSHDKLPLKRILLEYLLFLFLVMVVFFIRISFVARILLFIAALMTLVPKIKLLKPLYSE